MGPKSILLTRTLNPKPSSQQQSNLPSPCQGPQKLTLNPKCLRNRPHKVNSARCPRKALRRAAAAVVIPPRPSIPPRCQGAEHCCRFGVVSPCSPCIIVQKIAPKPFSHNTELLPIMQVLEVLGSVSSCNRETDLKPFDRLKISYVHLLNLYQRKHVFASSPRRVLQVEAHPGSAKQVPTPRNQNHKPDLRFRGLGSRVTYLPRPPLGSGMGSSSF